MITYKLSFIIKGKNLDFNNISSKIKITPTEIICEGYKLSKFVEESVTDFWVFEVDCQDEETLFDEIRKLYKKLLIEKKFLESLIEACDITTRIFINSQLAQIELLFPHEIVLLLSEIEIKFSISILSWGMVVNN